MKAQGKIQDYKQTECYENSSFFVFKSFLLGAKLNGRGLASLFFVVLLSPLISCLSNNFLPGARFTSARRQAGALAICHDPFKAVEKDEEREEEQKSAE